MSQRHRRSSYAAISACLLASLVGAAPAPASPEHQHCGPTADTVAPAITKVALNKPTVDVRKHDRPVRVTVEAHDVAAGTPVGIRSVRVLLGSGRDLIGPWHNLPLVSGSSTAGTWRTEITVPETSLTATWHIAAVVVTDADGNEQRYDQGRYADGGPHDLALFPQWPTQLKVVGDSAVPTKQPGALRTLAFSSRSVNTTGHARSVGITATVSGPAPVAVRLGLFPSPSGHHVYFPPVQLTRGADGRWTGALPIRQWLHTLTLNVGVTLVYGADSTRHHRKYTPDDLQQLGLPSTIHVTSGTDHHRPVLTGLTVTPTTVDTTAAAQQIAITATVSGGESGVEGGYIRLSPHPNAADHPIGSTYQNFTVHGNTLTATATIARCVLSGDWPINLNISDASGRSTSYDSTRLAKLGFPSALSVTSDPPGDRSPPYIKHTSASPANHTVTVTFKQPVKNATLGNLLVYRLGHFAHPVPATAISCSNGTSTVACDGSGGLATIVTLTVPSLGDHDYPVSPNQDSVVSQVTDAAGNPVPWWS